MIRPEARKRLKIYTLRSAALARWLLCERRQSLLRCNRGGPVEALECRGIGDERTEKRFGARALSRGAQRGHEHGAGHIKQPGAPPEPLPQGGDDLTHSERLWIGDDERTFQRGRGRENAVDRVHEIVEPKQRVPRLQPRERQRVGRSRELDEPGDIALSARSIDEREPKRRPIEPGLLSLIHI